MSFDWESFLEVAEHLDQAARAAVSLDAAKAQQPSPLTPGQVDAYFRSSVSRAYYSVHHLACDGVHRKEGKSFKGMTSRHQAVCDHLQKSKRPGWRKIGSNLRKLCQLRNKVDYDDALEKMPGNLASQALTWSRKIVVDAGKAFP